MPTQPALPESARNLARAQAGVLTWEQICGHGVSQSTVRTLMDKGLWTRLSRGIYLTHDLQPEWMSLAWAGQFLGGCDAAIGGRAALRLAGLISEEELPISIVLPHEARRQPSSGWWEFSRTRVPFRAVGEPARLRVERAIIDLCASEPERAIHWATLAIGSRKASVQGLRDVLETMPRHPRKAQLADVLADVGQGAESPLEVVYLRQVERPHGIPPGRRQVRGGRYRRDIYYPEGLVVELDGRPGHDGPDAFRDMDRDNYHARRGIATLRYGWDQCYNSPCEVAAEVAGVLRGLGWQGDFTPCSCCRLAFDGYWGLL